jgi:hypothetical protein
MQHTHLVPFLQITCLLLQGLHVRYSDSIFIDLSTRTTPSAQIYSPICIDLSTRTMDLLCLKNGSECCTGASSDPPAIRAAQACTRAVAEACRGVCIVKESLVSSTTATFLLAEASDGEDGRRLFTRANTAIARAINSTPALAPITSACAAAICRMLPAHVLPLSAGCC